jgi:hypothetical protein
VVGNTTATLSPLIGVQGSGGHHQVHVDAHQIQALFIRLLRLGILFVVGCTECLRAAFHPPTLDSSVDELRDSLSFDLSQGQQESTAAAAAAAAAAEQACWSCDQCCTVSKIPETRPATQRTHGSSTRHRLAHKYRVSASGH